MKQIKKHLKLIIIFLVCISIFFIYKANNKNNINYTALGDSFALGEDSYGRIDYGYSDYLKEYLIQKEKLNRYIKSFSTKTMSIEILTENISTNKKIILNKEEINLKQTLRESEMLTLSIGLNDLLYKLSITKEITDDKLYHIMDEISISFNKLIKEIKKYYHYEIYVIGYYDIDPSNEILSKAIQQLNELYQKNEDVTYISTYNIFKNNPHYLSNPNSIYPNCLGYKAITRQIISKIQKNLEK